MSETQTNRNANAKVNVNVAQDWALGYIKVHIYVYVSKSPVLGLVHDHAYVLN